MYCVLFHYTVYDERKVPYNVHFQIRSRPHSNYQMKISYTCFNYIFKYIRVAMPVYLHSASKNYITVRLNIN
jgi:hypothetical protein